MNIFRNMSGVKFYLLLVFEFWILLPSGREEEDNRGHDVEELNH